MIILLLLIFFLIPIRVSAYNSTGDVNNNSKIDIFDYNILVSSFGKNIPLSNFGWDPKLTKKLAATFKRDATYFEDCSDQSGGCFGNIASGGGFYTLAPDMGALGIPCKINSHESFDSKLPAGVQNCPYFFRWDTDTNDKLSAVLNLDSTDWTTPTTNNIYLGLQENLPYGVLYMGGKNLPKINNFLYHAKLLATINDLNTNQFAKTRFITGIAWYVPNIQKSFVLEMNFDTAGPEVPQWSTTDIATKNEYCAVDVLCLYLGGRYWNQPELINKGETTIDINWTNIIRKLIAQNYLPLESFGPYQIGGTYAGPEMLGRGNVSLAVSDIEMSATSADLNNNNLVDIFDYNTLVANFGKSL